MMTSDTVSPEALGKKARLFHDLIIQRRSLQQQRKATAPKRRSALDVKPRLKGSRSDV